MEQSWERQKKPKKTKTPLYIYARIGSSSIINTFKFLCLYGKLAALAGPTESTWCYGLLFIQTPHFFFLCIFRSLPSLNLYLFDFFSLTSNLAHFYCLFGNSEGPAQHRLYWAFRISKVPVC
jgi:hypothetical protein